MATFPLFRTAAPIESDAAEQFKRNLDSIKWYLAEFSVPLQSKPQIGEKINSLISSIEGALNASDVNLSAVQKNFRSIHTLLHTIGRHYNREYYSLTREFNDTKSIDLLLKMTSPRTILDLKSQYQEINDLSKVYSDIADLEFPEIFGAGKLGDHISSMLMLIDKIIELNKLLAKNDRDDAPAADENKKYSEIIEKYLEIVSNKNLKELLYPGYTTFADDLKTIDRRIKQIEKSYMEKIGNLDTEMPEHPEAVDPSYRDLAKFYSASGYKSSDAILNKSIDTYKQYLERGVLEPRPISLDFLQKLYDSSQTTAISGRSLLKHVGHNKSNLLNDLKLIAVDNKKKLAQDLSAERPPAEHSSDIESAVLHHGLRHARNPDGTLDVHGHDGTPIVKGPDILLTQDNNKWVTPDGRRLTPFDLSLGKQWMRKSKNSRLGAIGPFLKIMSIYDQFHKTPGSTPNSLEIKGMDGNELALEVLPLYFAYKGMPSEHRAELEEFARTEANINFSFEKVFSILENGSPSQADLSAIRRTLTLIEKIYANKELTKKYSEIAEPKAKELFDLDHEILSGHLRFRVLRDKDPQHLTIGTETNCCQHIGGVGEDSAIQSFVNPLAGILVLEMNSGEVWQTIAQSYFHWVPEKKLYILDNVEWNEKNARDMEKKYGTDIKSIYAIFAKEISQKLPHVTGLLAGLSYSKIGHDNDWQTGSMKSDPRYYHDIENKEDADDEEDGPDDDGDADGDDEDQLENEQFPGYTDFSPKKHINLAQPKFNPIPPVTPPETDSKTVKKAKYPLFLGAGIFKLSHFLTASRIRNVRIRRLVR